MSDPVLLKKIAQICIERDDAFWDAFLSVFERAAKQALRERRPIQEEPQVVALMDEFGRDAVLAGLREVQQIQLECLPRRVRPRRKQPLTRAQSDEIKVRVRSLGAPFTKGSETEFILDKYISLVLAQDLAKDTLSDENAPDDAKVLAQAIMGISQALELQRLRALDNLGTN